jgi:dual specificity tyrosine-phosphorylation-regulated kinase 2/3/4
MDSYFKFRPNEKINDFLILREINRGSYGSVLESINLNNKNKYAIKAIRNENRFRYQCKHEIDILQKLNKENEKNKYPIIKFFGFFEYQNHFCLIFELLSDVNLMQLLKKTKYKGLELKNVKKFSRQIALAIKYIHKHNYIHCDLKPQNIVMVNARKCKIKILDFGISRKNEAKNNYFLVQTLYYRAPEIFEKKNYNQEIDIWSFGCIIAELYTGFPFIYGKDEKKQYELILNVKKLINEIKSKNNDNLNNLKSILYDTLNLDQNLRINIENLIHKQFLNFNNI